MVCVCVYVWCMSSTLPDIARHCKVDNRWLVTRLRLPSLSSRSHAAHASRTCFVNSKRKDVDLKSERLNM